MIFMAVDRLYGRGVKLTSALLLLGFSTAVISFLPGYATIGAASIFLLGVCRVGQGLALGGAWDGLASLLSLNAPRNRRGWYAMIPQLGAPFGFLLASGLFAYFILNLTDEDFLSWGWRFPFYVAFTINVVALFARLRLVVTDEFVQAARKPRTGADERRRHVHGSGAVRADRRVRAARQLRPVPSGDDLPAELGDPVLPPVERSFLLVQCVGAVVGCRGYRPVRPCRRPHRPPAAACGLRRPDRPVQRHHAVPAGRRHRRADGVHHRGLRVAGAVLRPGVRRRDVQLLQPVPLHRRRA